MDAPTAGVLRDVAILVWIALLLGSLAYSWLRTARPTLAWNWGGQVNARPYNVLDAVVVAAISVIILSALRPGQEDAPKADVTAAPLVSSIAVTLVICSLLLSYLLGIRGLHPVELFGLRRLNFFKCVAAAFFFMLPTWILVSMVATGVSVWMQNFWPNQNAQDLVEAFRATDNLAVKTLMVAAAAIVAPLVEETFFRGLFYGVIKRYTDGYFAALCSSLLFAVVHFHMGSFVPLVVLAFAFCLAYEVTGTLLVPMLMHAIFNGTSLVFLAFFNKAT